MSQGLSFQSGDELRPYLTPIPMEGAGIPLAASVFPEEATRKEIHPLDALQDCPHGDLAGRPGQGVPPVTAPVRSHQAMA